MKRKRIFFENAGGAQVPQVVIDHVTVSLMRRHREKIGSETKKVARETLRRLLVGGEDIKTNSSSVVILGLNATSLLISLAQRYAKMLTPTDEVLISTENHLANFDPWIAAAKAAGATIKLWAPFHKKDHNLVEFSTNSSNCMISSNLEDLVSPQTRVAALPHASNVLGSIRPINDLCKMIKNRSRGRAHIVVDGVAVAPHEYVGFDEKFGGNVDWYVVSMHKLFGPHIGVLLGRRSQSMEEFLEGADASSSQSIIIEERIQGLIESGTANIEGCAGVVGLGMYFKSLSKWYQGEALIPEKIAVGRVPTRISDVDGADDMVSLREVKLAYRMIRRVEESLLKLLLRRLSRCPLLRIIDGSTMSGVPNNSYCDDIFRLPIVSFVHKIVPSRDIYTFCYQRGITCRHGFFLCTKYLAADLNFDENEDGALRVSLAHYNTSDEIEILCDVLENMPKWLGDP